ncbi:hypothetical protein BT63DRAFT_159233 [Microthyrium microscopicum]|uniref:Uncharacterized protein n=1 Tax=Microthyrium microscopicum TaxID=703497 RepID=A0A6A6UMP7_9PEZI|nr:hypothetical protein BT63DRAFT_159233 [Microthyrium microscopicum]
MAVDFKPLTLNLSTTKESLASGTIIPTPPMTPIDDSPKEGALATLQEENENATGLANGNVTPDSKLQAPLSPLSATSNGSGERKRTGVRKFLSLRSLRGEHHRPGTRGGDLASPTSKPSYDFASRPGSQYTASTSDSALKHKKSSGWFGSTGSKRKSMFVVGRLDEQLADNPTPPETAKPKGPPPPTIPEFSLGKDLEMGGEDMFKNIH